MERIRTQIARHADLLAWALVAIVIGNVVFQFYTHKTTTLTSWKGGGFGMYTDPHSNSRSIWLQVEGQEGMSQFIVYPRSKLHSDWIEASDRRGRAGLRRVSTIAAKMRYYPRRENAEDLIKAASRIAWTPGFVGDLTPKEGQYFKRADYRVLVYENYDDVQNAQIERRKIFDVGYPVVK